MNKYLYYSIDGQTEAMHIVIFVNTPISAKIDPIFALKLRGQPKKDKYV